MSILLMFEINDELSLILVSASWHYRQPRGSAVVWLLNNETAHAAHDLDVLQSKYKLDTTK